MTSLNQGPLQPQPSTPSGSQDAAVRPAVSAEVAQQHATERWDRQIVAAEQQSAAGRMRFGIIAAVVIVGIVTWLALTL
jgi:hypothetical protein